jgi:hypothetical protein
LPPSLFSQFLQSSTVLLVMFIALIAVMAAWLSVLMVISMFLR